MVRKESTKNNNILPRSRRERLERRKQQSVDFAGETNLSTTLKEVKDKFKDIKFPEVPFIEPVPLPPKDQVPTDPNELFPVHRLPFNPEMDPNRRLTGYKKKSLSVKYTRPFEAHYLPYFQRYGCFTHLVTLNILRDEVTRDEAWRIVDLRIRRLMKEFQEWDANAVKFVFAAVEIHVDRSNTTTLDGKSKDVDPDEDIMDDGGKYVGLATTSEGYRAEVLRAFNARDDKLRKDEAINHGEVYERLTKYLRHIADKLSDKTYEYVSTLTDYLTFVNNNRHHEGAIQHLIRMIEDTPELYKIAYDQLATAGIIEVSKSAISSKSLRGYPHVHLALVCKATGHNGGKGITKADIQSFIYRTGLFIDAQVDKRGPEFYNDKGIHDYVMKQLFQYETYAKLQHNPLTYYNIDGDPQSDLLVSNFARQAKLERYIDNLPQIDQTHAAAASSSTTHPKSHVINDHTSPLDWRRTPQMTYPKPNDISHQVGNQILSYMCSNRIYVEHVPSWDKVRKVHLYRHIPGSKMSVEIIGTPGDIINMIMQGVKDVSLDRHFRRHIAKMEEPGQRIFPAVDVCYGWVEYKDFFLHVRSGTVTFSQDRFACHKYFPDFTHAQYKELLNKSRVPERWFKFFSNNKYAIPETNKLTPEGEKFIRANFNLITRRNLKDQTFLLLGKPDVGKTIFMTALLNTLIPEMVTTLAESKFGKDSLSNSMVVVLEEAENLTQYNLRPSTMKRFHDRNSTIKSDVKFKQPETSYVRANIVCIANEAKWYYEEVPPHNTTPSLTPTDGFFNQPAKPVQRPKSALMNRYYLANFEWKSDLTSADIEKMHTIDTPDILAYVSIAGNEFKCSVVYDIDELRKITEKHYYFNRK